MPNVRTKIGLRVLASVLFSLVAFGTLLLFLFREAPEPAAAPANPIFATRTASDRARPAVRIEAHDGPDRDAETPMPSSQPPRDENRDAPDATQARPRTDAEFEELYGEPRIALVREAIETALRETYVDYRLSSDELDLAAASLFRQREIRLELAALPMGPETAEQRRGLLDELDRVTGDFTHLLEMDPAEFTAALSQEGDGGIDHDDGDADYVPDDDFLEAR